MDNDINSLLSQVESQIHKPPDTPPTTKAEAVQQMLETAKKKRTQKKQNKRIKKVFTTKILKGISANTRKKYPNRVSKLEDKILKLHKKDIEN